ncbi:MAG TPA: hypothetical protein ENN80_07600, partial [Candidatus Hydrogenedentes bacterium]|nr:hypothetical protein [Candidatus Hydrogenedentota bacterium]
MTREEQASIEIGQTDITPGVARFLVCVFLLTIFALPLVDQFADFNKRLHDESARSLQPAVFGVV